MSDTEKILERLDSINSTVLALSDRVSKIELRTPVDVGADPPPVVDDQQDRQDGGATGDNDVSVSPYYDSVRVSTDIQRDFESLKDSLNRVPLPKDYKINDSARGIGKDNKSTLTVLSKCARFAETGLKVFVTLQPISEDEQLITLQKNDVQKLFTVLAAQANFLQGEYASLVVKATFDEETSRLFRSFENNTGAFSNQSLQNIRLAAELASHSSQRSRGRGRGNWTPNRGYRGFRGAHRGDFHNRDFHNRGFFPTRPPGREDTADS